jgi:hypothetical protein
MMLMHSSSTSPPATPPMMTALFDDGGDEFIPTEIATREIDVAVTGVVDVLPLIAVVTVDTLALVNALTLTRVSTVMLDDISVADGVVVDTCNVEVDRTVEVIINNVVVEVVGIIAVVDDVAEHTALFDSQIHLLPQTVAFVS